MHTLERHPLAVPALWLGTLDDFLFPEGGTDVPFTITTVPFIDTNGNEGLVLRRRFETSPSRTFVDTLRWNPARGCLTDLFGRHGLVAADIHVTADGDRLALSIGTQWVRAGSRYVPIPESMAADGRLRDWYDDEAEQYRVTAEITAPLLGTVFGYDGAFEHVFRPLEASAGETDGPPAAALQAVDLPGENA